MVEFLKSIQSNKWFDIFITFIIVLAGLLVGLETNPEIVKSYGHILHFLDRVVVAIFVLEIAVNMGVEGKKFWRFFYSGWHIFDFIIVLLCIIPDLMGVSAQYFAAFRLIRLVRLVKLLERIQNLKILLSSILRSIPSFSYVIIFLFLLFYIFGVLGVDLFGKANPTEFGDLSTSMKTLFRIVTEGASTIYEPEAIDESGLTWVDAFVADKGFPAWIVELYSMSFMVIGAMIFLNLFIGIITADMGDAKANENAGKSRIHKKDHTVILGWSQEIYTVIEQLIETNKEKEWAYIVILADRDIHEMENEIDLRIQQKATTTILYRSGNPIDISELSIVNPSKAKSIIILGENENSNSDLDIMKALLALTSLKDLNEETSIVAEIRDADILETAKLICGDKAAFLTSEEFIARLTAQTAIQPGLSKIYEEIFGFDGSEFYIKNVPDTYGKSFSEISFMFEECVPIGLFTKTGECKINPDRNTVCENGDSLIILSLDNESIKVSNNKSQVQENLIRGRDKKEHQAQNFLMLGWNHKSENIIKELDSYGYKGSNLLIATPCEEAYDIVESIKESCTSLNVRFQKNKKISARKELEFLLSEYKFDHIILQTDQTYIDDIQTADSHTLITLVNIRDIANKYNYEFSILTEIQDNRNAELAKKSNPNDFIIDADFNSKVLAQLSENRKLSKVFNELLTAEGSEIYLRPVEYYVTIGKEVNFATICEAALRQHEVAIGLIINDGNVINPSKSFSTIFSNNDRVVVVSEN